MDFLDESINGMPNLTNPKGKRKLGDVEIQSSKRVCRQADEACPEAPKTKTGGMSDSANEGSQIGLFKASKKLVDTTKAINHIPNLAGSKRKVQLSSAPDAKSSQRRRLNINNANAAAPSRVDKGKGKAHDKLDQQPAIKKRKADEAIQSPILKKVRMANFQTGQIEFFKSTGVLDANRNVNINASAVNLFEELDVPQALPQSAQAKRQDSDHQIASGGEDNHLATSEAALSSRELATSPDSSCASEPHGREELDESQALPSLGSKSIILSKSLLFKEPNSPPSPEDLHICETRKTTKPKRRYNRKKKELPKGEEVLFLFRLEHYLNVPGGLTDHELAIEYGCTTNLIIKSKQNVLKKRYKKDEKKWRALWAAKLDQQAKKRDHEKQRIKEEKSAKLKSVQKQKAPKRKRKESQSVKCPVNLPATTAKSLNWQPTAEPRDHLTLSLPAQIYTAQEEDVNDNDNLLLSADKVRQLQDFIGGGGEAMNSSAMVNLGPLIVHDDDAYPQHLSPSHSMLKPNDAHDTDPHPCPCPRVDPCLLDSPDDDEIHHGSRNGTRANPQICRPPGQWQPEGIDPRLLRSTRSQSSNPDHMPVAGQLSAIQTWDENEIDDEWRQDALVKAPLRASSFQGCLELEDNATPAPRLYFEEAFLQWEETN